MTKPATFSSPALIARTPIENTKYRLTSGPTVGLQRISRSKRRGSVRTALILIFHFNYAQIGENRKPRPLRYRRARGAARFSGRPLRDFDRKCLPVKSVCTSSCFFHTKNDRCGRGYPVCAVFLLLDLRYLRTLQPKTTHEPLLIQEKGVDIRLCRRGRG